MAGHYPLKREDESALFTLVGAIKSNLITKSQGKSDFEKFSVPFKGKFLTAMRLSKDYVEEPISEIAFKVGKVNTKSIKGEHRSLTHNIDVEVHLILNKERTQTAIKNIFWVA